MRLYILIGSLVAVVTYGVLDLAGCNADRTIEYSMPVLTITSTKSDIPFTNEGLEDL